MYAGKNNILFVTGITSMQDIWNALPQSRTLYKVYRGMQMDIFYLGLMIPHMDISIV